MTDEAAPSSPEPVALTRSPGFWPSIGHAAVFGVVLAFAALASLGLVRAGTPLCSPLRKPPPWGGGPLGGVRVTAGAGLLVGALRHFTRLPPKLPGTVEELH